MSVNIKSNPDGTSGAIQVNGVDSIQFNATGIIGGIPTSYVTLTDTQSLTNKTLVSTVLEGGFTEEVYTLTGTEISAANGSIQTKTITAETTFTETLTSGQSVVLELVDGNLFGVNWIVGMNWITSGGNVAPTLTGLDVVVLWKVGGTLRGAYVGSGV